MPLDYVFQDKMQKILMTIVELSIFNGYKRFVPTSSSEKKFLKKRQKQWISVFVSLIKILSALGACHVTIV